MQGYFDYRAIYSVDIIPTMSLVRIPYAEHELNAIFRFFRLAYERYSKGNSAQISAVAGARISCAMLRACCESPPSGLEGLPWAPIWSQQEPFRSPEAGFLPFRGLSTTDTVGLASRRTFATGS